MAFNELNRYPGSRGGKAPKEEANQRLTRILSGALTTGVLGLSGCGPSSTEIRPTPTNEPEPQTTIRPTPTKEPEAQPTNLVFTLAKEKQNDPDFQRLNQANTSFFQEFKKRNPQNPWQLGETVALGVDNVDYALTTVVGQNGEPILGVVSHLDKDGKPQSGFAIDFVTTIPSNDGGRAFGGIYPLKPEISQSLLEGKTVTIDPKKDTQGPIFGFVLRQGKNWQDFSVAMNKATTEEQRKEVFSDYVEFVYVREQKDGNNYLFPVNELSPYEQNQLVSYALPTATPDTIELTPTPTTTPTPQPPPTPEPTPIPTIEVNGLQLPDPRITNPELFDLKKKEAPIPQFVNAMQEIGINIDPQTVITELGKNYEIRQGPDGKTYILTTYTVEGKNGIRYSMGLIAEQDERGEWKWRSLDLLAAFKKLHGIEIGTSVAASDGNFYNSSLHRAALKEFSILKTVGFDPRTFERFPHVPRYQTQLARELGKAIYPGSIIHHHEIPSSWDKKPPTDKEIEDYIDQRIKKILEHIKQAGGGYVDIVSEAMWYSSHNNKGWENSPFYKLYGEDLIAKVYVKAYNEAKKLGMEPGVDVVFLYNDYGIEMGSGKSDFVYEQLKRSIERISKELGIEKVPIEIAMQFHVFSNTELAEFSTPLLVDRIDPNRISLNIQKFGNLGPVHIAELQINGVTDVQKVNDALNLIIQIGIQNKNIVRSITFYQMFSRENLWKAINPEIFNRNFQRTSNYYRILGQALSALH
jgi:GH35 family endo-1,4-beta-xylanase